MKIFFLKIKSCSFNFLQNLINFIFKILFKKPMVLSSAHSIKLLLETKKSLTRFGDGEFSLLMGKSISFQNSSLEIKERLRKIIRNDNSNILVGIPFSILSGENLLPIPRNYWRNYYRKNYIKIAENLNFDQLYIDSLLTRFYLDVADKQCALENFSLLKQLWNNQKILIIEGERSRLGVGNHLFDNVISTRRIIIPGINAFGFYRDILSTVRHNHQTDELILIAAGPTATILAYDLANEERRALDVGHLDIEYEWMINGATFKAPVANKNIGDLLILEENDDFYNEDYEKSIIAKIGL